MRTADPTVARGSLLPAGFLTTAGLDALELAERARTNARSVDVTELARSFVAVQEAEHRTTVCPDCDGDGVSTASAEHATFHRLDRVWTFDVCFVCAGAGRIPVYVSPWAASVGGAA